MLSRDEPHGLKIDELSFSIKAERPEQGEEFGDPVNAILDLPNDDTELRGYEHIDIGLGADDMELLINVGNPINFTGVIMIISILIGCTVLTYYYFKINPQNPSKDE